MREVLTSGRSLLRVPAFSLAVILTIALGIGVNTAVFSVIHSVLLDPLPFRDPQRLVHIAGRHPDVPSLQIAAPDFADFQRQSTTFEAMAAYTFQAMNKWTILGDGEPEVVQVVQASHELFDLLGIQPLLGRTYTADETAKKAPVVLLSEALWRRKYGSDPSILRRTIRLVDWPVTVIGVLPQRQAQPGWGDVWMSMAFLDPALTDSRRFRALEVVGRLRPGVRVEQAQAELEGIATALARSFPETNGRVGVSVTPLVSWMTGEVRPALIVAWASVLLVLLLACANVAHLVLVRTVDRSREFAVRAALGAGFGRITRHLLVENLLLAAAGGLLGAWFAHLSLPVLTRLGSAEIPRFQSPAVSPAALMFGACATAVCLGIFLLPAVFQTRGIHLHDALKQGSTFLSGRRRSWFCRSVIATEIALAFVVLTGAGLLYGSFSSLVNEDKGFSGDGVLAVDVGLAVDWERSAQLFEQQVAPALRSLPGVLQVAAVNTAPMALRASEASRFTSRFRVAGATYAGDELPVAQIRWITPEYFRALQIPLKNGRLFTDADTGKPGYIINEALARKYFGARDPVGQHILYGLPSTKEPGAPVIGVVGDVRDLGLHMEPVPTLYSIGISNRITILVRSGVDSLSIAPAVRSIIRAASPDAPILLAAPLNEVIRTSVGIRRFALQLLLIFAALAVILVVIGVYGVASYSLSRRRGEFAIRAALGADQRRLQRFVLRGFAGSAAVGLGLGVVLSRVFAYALRSQLYKMSPADPAVFFGTGVLVVVLLLLSALKPASDAASTSPVSVLREL